MDMVLGELLREETRIATQAILEGKRTVKSVLLQNKASENRFKGICPKLSVLNARSLAMWYRTVKRRMYVFIVNNLGIL
ncbi:hypothetical protein RHGRI_026159 [Rhododendron griersonianum]|uniref:Uncharacterized protein n=1 Tax=Rhododendron griersonianum TaxID=479676 RepID=A0AAV6IRN2_9ERIC|nr:hypothetical protein RHGRI_026159 [Rhododendron griersonianum]